MSRLVPRIAKAMFDRAKKRSYRRPMAQLLSKFATECGAGPLARFDMSARQIRTRRAAAAAQQQPSVHHAHRAHDKLDCSFTRTRHKGLDLPF